jgi:hypothetical protein
MSASGRLSVALYTLRPVEPGEELTFNYACITEVGRGVTGSRVEGAGFGVAEPMGLGLMFAEERAGGYEGLGGRGSRARGFRAPVQGSGGQAAPSSGRLCVGPGPCCVVNAAAAAAPRPPPPTSPPKGQGGVSPGHLPVLLPRLRRQLPILCRAERVRPRESWRGKRGGAPRDTPATPAPCGPRPAPHDTPAMPAPALCAPQRSSHARACAPRPAPPVCIRPLQHAARHWMSAGRGRASSGA